MKKQTSIILLIGIVVAVIFLLPNLGLFSISPPSGYSYRTGMETLEFGAGESKLVSPSSLGYYGHDYWYDVSKQCTTSTSTNPSPSFKTNCLAGQYINAIRSSTPIEEKVFYGDSSATFTTTIRECCILNIEIYQKSGGGCSGLDPEECMANTDCIVGWFDCINFVGVKCEDINPDLVNGQSPCLKPAKCAIGVDKCVDKISGCTANYPDNHNGGCTSSNPWCFQNKCYSGSENICCELHNTLTGSDTYETRIFDNCRLSTVPILKSVVDISYCSGTPVQTCSQLGGKVCLDTEKCNIDLVKAKDTDFCCKGSCNNACNNDGICSASETYATCPNDCRDGGGGDGGGGDTKSETLTWTEYYSMSDDKFKGTKTRCATTSDCSQVSGDYTVKCLQDDQITERRFSIIKDECDKNLGWWDEIIQGILRLGSGNLIRLDFCGSYAKTIESFKGWLGGTGTCIAESNTWYGSIWEDYLKFIGGLGLPASWVLMAAVGMLIILVVVIISLLK